MKAKETKKVRGVFEKVPGSGEWWIRFANGLGKPRREKAGTKSAAIALYRKRKQEVLEGKKLPGTLRSVVKVADVAPLLRRDYELNHKKTVVTLGYRLEKHIIPFFGDLPVDLAAAEINHYIDKRRKAGAANATINRELAALKRMFNLARRAQPPLVTEMPVFPSRLKENPPRSGFAEVEQYAALQRHAAHPWLKALLEMAYTYGFRRSELLLGLKVGQVDANRGVIRLLPGTTKNDEARLVYMTTRVSGLLRLCLMGKQPDDFVFTHKDGSPVLDFRGAWWALCEKSGLGKFVNYLDSKGRTRKRWQGLLFHDLRRSAVRNMVRHGVPEVVAMKISGHKTRAVFERYNIVSESDLAEAARKLEHTLEPTDTTTDTRSSREFTGYAAAAD